MHELHQHDLVAASHLIVSMFFLATVREDAECFESLFLTVYFALRGLLLRRYPGVALRKDLLSQSAPVCVSSLYRNILPQRASCSVQQQRHQSERVTVWSEPAAH